MRPFYEDESVTLYCGDCREVLPMLPPADAIVTDPPYGETTLQWDRAPDPAWLQMASIATRNLWCFGSLRFWLEQGAHFSSAGWKLAQDVVWEKHNGSGLHGDRFKRVHELAVHWYRGEWASIHKDVPVTHDATARTIRRKAKPTHHQGARGPSVFASEDGGPRLTRSVIQVRSEHGRAVHPTQKPLGILRPLISYSCPAGGVVVDPFAGSGSTLIAARDLGRRAIGIEAREDYCEAAVARLAQGVLA